MLVSVQMLCLANYCLGCCCPFVIGGECGFLLEVEKLNCPGTLSFKIRTLCIQSNCLDFCRYLRDLPKQSRDRRWVKAPRLKVYRR